MRNDFLNNKFIKLLGAILTGIIIFCISPEVINNIGTLDFLLIATPIIILSFYYLARKYENYYLLVLASLILFSSVFVNIQVGILLVLIFPLIYLADVFKNKDRKSGLSAFAIVIGIYLIAALWIQDWIPGYKNTTLFALGFNMGGVILILFWIAWIQRSWSSAYPITSTIRNVPDTRHGKCRRVNTLQTFNNTVDGALRIAPADKLTNSNSHNTTINE